MTPNQIEEAALFRELGLSWRKIGNCFNVGHWVAMDRVQKFNIRSAANK